MENRYKRVDRIEGNNTHFQTVDISYDKDDDKYIAHWKDRIDMVHKVFNNLEEAREFGNEYTNPLSRRALKIYKKCNIVNTYNIYGTKVLLYKDDKHVSGKTLYFTIHHKKDGEIEYLTYYCDIMGLFLESDELNNDIEKLSKELHREKINVLTLEGLDEEESYVSDNGTTTLYLKNIITNNKNESYFYKCEEEVELEQALRLQEKVIDTIDKEIEKDKERMEKYLDVNLRDLYDLYIVKIKKQENIEGLSKNSINCDFAMNLETKVEGIVRCIVRWKELREIRGKCSRKIRDIKYTIEYGD